MGVHVSLQDDQSDKRFLHLAILEAVRRSGGHLKVSGPGRGLLFECYRSIEGAPELDDNLLWKRMAPAAHDLRRYDVLLAGEEAERGWWRFVGGMAEPPIPIPELRLNAVYVFAVLDEEPRCKLGGSGNFASRHRSLIYATRNGSYPSGSGLRRVFIIPRRIQFRTVERWVQVELKALGVFDTTMKYGKECFFLDAGAVARVTAEALSVRGIPFAEYPTWPIAHKDRVRRVGPFDG